MIEMSNDERDELEEALRLNKAALGVIHMQTMWYRPWQDADIISLAKKHDMPVSAFLRAQLLLLTVKPAEGNDQLSEAVGILLGAVK